MKYLCVSISSDYNTSLRERLMRPPRSPRDGVNRELAIFLVVNRELGYGRDRELGFFWS